MNKYYPEGHLIDTKENKAALANQNLLFESKEKRVILEARASSCDSEHNLIVDLNQFSKGIIPRSEGAIGIIEGTTRDIAILSRVNKPVSFVITDFSQNSVSKKQDVILSRKQAQEMCMEEKISKLIPGDIIKARITHLENFGVFADIGCGIISFLPIDAISISRIAHPCERFYVGQDINVIVKSICGDRVNLSHKELLGTWEENVKEFSTGETVKGIIRSIEDYGIFIELAPNLAGLAEYRGNLNQGQTATVYIKNIIPEKMKIKLVIIETFSEQQEIKPVRYFFEGNHMKKFLYSPQNCAKLIETDFTNVDSLIKV